MVTDRQVRRLMSFIRKGKSVVVAAAKADMDEKTARKYLRAGRVPSELSAAHTWRTRPDPFAEVWEYLREQLVVNPGLEAKTLFQELQRQDPGRFADGQLRTLQRRVKQWRALEGPPKEVFFAQRHYPGDLGASDFTWMTRLGVTIQGVLFEHLWYHFVLTYSNWEHGSICFSESFESLSAGLQTALWALGGVPRAHRTDRLTMAVHQAGHRDTFTQRYDGLLRHYGIEGAATNAASPNENGDVEQRHHRWLRAVEQALLLRGSRDFASRTVYDAFLRTIERQLNAGRQARFADDRAALRPLPARRLETATRVLVRVGVGSTIRVLKNTYSVHSRLIGARVEVRCHVEHLEIWIAQRCVDRLPRLRGEGKHRIDYRHVIDWLVRKPGAFANYRYRADLFPTTRFRVAYDRLCHTHPARASKEYLRILHLAATESEARVDDALRGLLATDDPVTAERVTACVQAGQTPPSATDVTIDPVNLLAYDHLLTSVEVSR